MSAPWRDAVRGAGLVSGFMLRGWKRHIFRADIDRRQMLGVLPASALRPLSLSPQIARGSLCTTP